jgi:hypothetical protein
MRCGEVDTIEVPEPQAELLLEDRQAAIVLQVLIQPHPIASLPQDAGQHGPAHLDGLSAQPRRPVGAGSYDRSKNEPIKVKMMRPERDGDTRRTSCPRTRWRDAG